MIHGRRWWHTLAVGSYFAWTGSELIELPHDEIERQAAVMFLPEQLQLATKQVDPAREKDLFLLDEQGLRGLTERQARALPSRTWARMLPAWLARRLFPDQLEAGEQRDLDFLMRQPWPLSKAAARALIGGSAERFRKIWRLFPEERKLNRGRQRGYRLSDAAVQLLRLRKK
jgi:hypothetical protein